MDGYGLDVPTSNLHNFNLLLRYQQESLFKDGYRFDNGFGFDPSPAKQNMPDLYPGTIDSLSMRAYQLPDQLSPTCLQQQRFDQTLAPAKLESSRPVQTPLSGHDDASTWSGYEEATRRISGSLVTGRVEKMHTPKPSIVTKSSKHPSKPRRKKTCQSSSTSQPSQKELALEKNRVAAAKCRIKK